MKMRGRNIVCVLLTAAAALCAACSKSPAEERLAEIESFLCEKPDSARVLLEEMAADSTLTEGATALRALLHYRAVDKSGPNQTDDTLLKIAEAYFVDKGKGSDHHRMLTHYYRGQNDFFNGRHGDAIISLHRAEELAQALNDILNLALIYRTKFDLYLKIDDAPQAELYAKLSYDKFCESPVLCAKYIPWARLELANAYFFNNKPEIAKQLLDSVLDEAVAFNRTSLRANAYNTYAKINLSQKDLKSAEEHLLKIQDIYGAENLSQENYKLLCITYAHKRDLEKAKFYNDHIDGSRLSKDRNEYLIAK